jgi:hypothetical protein
MSNVSSYDIGKLTEKLKHLARAQDRVADAEHRKADALERIAQALEAPQLQQPEPAPVASVYTGLDYTEGGTR